MISQSHLFTLLALTLLVSVAAAQSCTDGQRTGSCMKVSDCQGTTKRGLCPGASNIRCCFAAEAPAAPAPPASTPAPRPEAQGCSDGTRNGLCMEESACTGTARAGLGCVGATASFKCCFERAVEVPPVPAGDPCSDGTRSGTCLDVSLCAGEAQSGLCPGSSRIQCCFTSRAEQAPPPPPPAGGGASYNPNPPVPSGPGFDRSYSGLQASSHDAGGPVYFKSKAAIDSDGSGPHHGDPWAQSQTSLKMTNGVYMNADLSPYFVLPPAASKQFGVKIGDLALLRYRGKTCAAIFADVGPSAKIGEISVQAAKLLGIPWSPVNGGAARDVETWVYPGSRKAGGVGPADVTPDALALALAAAQQRLGGGSVGRSAGAADVRADGDVAADARAVDVAAFRSAPPSELALGVITGVLGTLVVVGLIALVLHLRRARAARLKAAAADQEDELLDAAPSPAVSKRV